MGGARLLGQRPRHHLHDRPLSRQRAPRGSLPAALRAATGHDRADGTSAPPESQFRRNLCVVHPRQHGGHRPRRSHRSRPGRRRRVLWTRHLHGRRATRGRAAAPSLPRRRHRGGKHGRHAPDHLRPRHGGLLVGSRRQPPASAAARSRGPSRGRGGSLGGVGRAHPSAAPRAVRSGARPAARHARRGPARSPLLAHLCAAGHRLPAAHACPALRDRAALRALGDGAPRGARTAACPRLAHPSTRPTGLHRRAPARV